MRARWPSASAPSTTGFGSSRISPRARPCCSPPALHLPPGARCPRWVGVSAPPLKLRTYAPDFLALARGQRAVRLLTESIDRRNGHGLLNTLLALDLHTYLPDDLLAKV